jgi:hypothetical protein
VISYNYLPSFFQIQTNNCLAEELAKALKMERDNEMIIDSVTVYLHQLK